MRPYRLLNTGCSFLGGLGVALLVVLAGGCDKTAVPEPAQTPQAQTQPQPLVPLPILGVCTSLSNADKLKAAGYDYIEEGVQRLLIPQSPAETFAPNLVAALSASLPVYAYAGFLPGELTCVGPDAVHDEILVYARTAFERAGQIGSRIIVFGSGRSRRVPEGVDVEAATLQFIELLKKMGPLAAEHGIIVAIEPLNKNECNLVNTVRQGTAIVRAVNHPGIRVLADVYHMALEDEGPESIIEAGPLLAHVHIAEKDGRSRPGAGGYDFVPYFTALRQINYTGGISMECRWQNFDDELLPALVSVKEQIDRAWAQ